MTLDEAGKNFIKAREKLMLSSYKDEGGVWTIGYGHTGDVTPGMLISKHQADVIFDLDIEKFEECVAKACRLNYLSQPQFNALVSLCFNIGIHQFETSTLLARFQAGGTLVAAPRFMDFVYDNGILIKGLHNRRKMELNLFLNGVYT